MNAPGVTLQPHVTKYIAYRVKRGEIDRRTARKDAYQLGKFAESYGHRPLDKLGPAAIDDYFATLTRRAPSTQRHYLGRVRGFLRWLHDERVIRRDPTYRMPRVRQPDTIPVTFTREEVAAILTACPDDRAKAIVWLIVGLALRCCEVARLTFVDYDQRNGVMLIRGKGAKEREIPVPPEVASALETYGIRGPGPLIRSYTQPWRGMSPVTLSNYFAEWSRQAGVKKRPFDGKGAHGGRRTAISEVIESSGDPEAGQALAGHALITTTYKYYKRRLLLEQLRDAMAKRGVLSSLDQAA